MDYLKAGTQLKAGHNHRLLAIQVGVGVDWLGLVNTDFRIMVGIRKHASIYTGVKC